MNWQITVNIQGHLQKVKRNYFLISKFSYEYAKTILDLMTRGDPHPEGKFLFIGGGIANFTNVAATFKGTC